MYILNTYQEIRAFFHGPVVFEVRVPDFANRDRTVFQLRCAEGKQQANTNSAVLLWHDRTGISAGDMNRKSNVALVFLQYKLTQHDKWNF